MADHDSAYREPANHVLAAPRRLPARLRGRPALVVPFTPARTAMHGRG